MNLFPESYSPPVLVGIVDAAENGWNAECSSGSTPSSSPLTCSSGGDPSVLPLCPGMGGSVNSNRLFNNSGHSSGNTRLINPDDVGGGL